MYNRIMNERQWVVAHRNTISIFTYCEARSNRTRMPRQEHLLARDPQIAYLYALKVLNGRFVEGEEAISRSPEWAVRYARFVLERRFKIAERFIAQDTRWAYEYAIKVVKDRLPKGMHRRMKSMAGDHFAKKYLESGLCGGGSTEA